MKAKKIKCPICSKDMIAINYGYKREHGYTAVVTYCNWECRCGCKIEYKGKIDCLGDKE